MNEFEKMNEMLTKMTPPEMAGAVNMLAHPVAGAAAMSALGFGLASQALGVWMGGLTGAAEASQRFWQAVPGGFADPSASPLAKARARARALMENAQSAAREAAEAGAVVRPAAAAERPAAVRPEGLQQAEAPDDLKAISGIGPKLEKVLNGLGIRRFAQVAAWTPQEIAWMDGHLGLGGRIGRDDWIGQAARLAGGRT